MIPCLYELAASGRLPDHQFMDERTLDWIESKEGAVFPSDISPRLNHTTLTASSIIELLDQFTPLIEWYSNPSLAKSIHGLRHTLRVIVLTRVVAEILATNATKPDVYIAASIHDLRRENDRQDPDHGQRAAFWWLKHKAMVCERYRAQEVDSLGIASAIRLHEIAQEDFSGEDRDVYGVYRRDVDTLKLADALDRYRLPKAKWWIDDRKTPTAAPITLKRFAFQLMLRSERTYLAGQLGEDAVRDAVMGMLQ